MDYGSIIKRSWSVTWRYKALWALGLFAGISGCQAGGSSGGGGGGGSGGNNGFEDLSGFSGGDFFGSRLSSNPFAMGSGAESYLIRLLPVIIAATLIIMLLALIWSILAVAARGGLIIGVDEAERGRTRRLGELWSAGFGRFWPLVGLGILLKLPIVAAVLLLMLAVFVPLIGTVAGGGSPGAEVFVPICGSLAIGLPVVVLGAVLLDLLYLLALRYLMLGGQAVFESAGNAWRFFRARFKDSALMYVINAALNIAGSIALAVPLIALGFAMVVPVIAGASMRRWDVIAGPIALFVLAAIALAYLYTAIMGTFTSSLWTLFFRDSMAPAAPESYVTPAPPQADA